MGPPPHSKFLYPESDDHATASSIAASLSFLMQQERSAYACRDYLEASCTVLEDDGGVTPGDRQRLVDWCYEIVDHCDLSREAVAVAMNMVDRFMSLEQDRRSRYHRRHEYQLLTMTALYVSIKIHEPFLFGSTEFAMVTRGTCSPAELEETESELLQGLDWQLCATTPKRVGTRLLELLEVNCIPQDQDYHEACSSDDDSMMIPEGTVEQSTWNFLHDEMSFHTENAVRDYSLTTQRSSTVAAASILKAIEQVDNADYELLMKTFVRILKKFDFADASTLLYCFPW